MLSTGLFICDEIIKSTVSASKRTEMAKKEERLIKKVEFML